MQERVARREVVVAAAENRLLVAAQRLRVHSATRSALDDEIARHDEDTRPVTAVVSDFRARHETDSDDGFPRTSATLQRGCRPSSARPGGPRHATSRDLPSVSLGWPDDHFGRVERAGVVVVGESSGYAAHEEVNDDDEMNRGVMSLVERGVLTPEQLMALLDEGYTARELLETEGLAEALASQWVTEGDGVVVSETGGAVPVTDEDSDDDQVTTESDVEEPNVRLW